MPHVVLHTWPWSFWITRLAPEVLHVATEAEIFCHFSGCSSLNDVPVDLDVVDEPVAQISSAFSILLLVSVVALSCLTTAAQPVPNGGSSDPRGGGGC